jgi:F0F1-type ATP synthase membrane subunit b/b'
MDEPTLAPVEMQLMALGAALVGARIEINGREAARIVADAMDHIDQLRKQLHELRKRETDRKVAKAKARRPR